jgi:hypothetical protein
MLFAGCSKELDACKANLSSCQAGLFATAQERDNLSTQLTNKTAAFDQYKLDMNQTVSDLNARLTLSKEREEYWRVEAENQTVTVGILAERVQHLQGAKQTSFWSSAIAFLGEVVLGIALHFFGRTADAIDPGFAARNKRRRFWLNLTLCAILILTAGIIFISAR